MKINRQLQLGLGLILLFVVLLGGMAWFLTDHLWQNTSDLYHHPLAVRRAIAEFQADILQVNLTMHDLYYAADETEILGLVQRIETSQNHALKQIDIFYEQYLGPRSDVDLVDQYFTEWKVIRNENINRVREGRREEALQDTVSTEPDGRQMANLLSALDTMSQFALGKGDEFYQDALRQRRSMVIGLWVMMGSILLVTLAITYGLVRNINEPLRALTSAAKAFQQGDTHARSAYTSRNEFGRLSDAFNGLAENIQHELQHRQNHQVIAETMLRSNELHNFSLAVLQSLMEHTHSQVGAVYLLNEAQKEFEPVESIGFQPDALRAFSAAAREGEFGTCLVTQQIQYLADIPADTRHVFSTISGDFLPRAMLTIPILQEGQVIAMISLASLHEYTPAARLLVNDMWSVLTARLNGVLAVQKVRQVSAQLADQNRELEAQARELGVQADELSEQNIELEIQKRQLTETNRLKTSFLSNMSHELRTPLNSIIALSDVLGRRLNGKVPQTEYGYLEVIERNGRHLLDMINTILDLSRIEAGKEEIDISPVAIGEVIRSVVMMIEPMAQEKGIVLKDLVDDRYPSIRSDAVKLRHILQNLVGNAVKFTHQGEVEISVIQADDRLRIAVRDTGIGIAADQIPFIFDEFRQADDSFSRQYGGTGLGLAIAKKYAQLLGGSIDVNSTIGVGSTFTLTLPLVFHVHSDAKPGATFNKSISDREPLVDPDCTAKKILLVEDSEPAVVQLSDILFQQGCQVRVARNGREALEQIATELPDAIILDLMMPEVDGFEVLRMIRSQAQTALLPVLILTAKHVTREELSFLKGNHIHQLIRKGEINRENLLSAVKRMLTPAEVLTRTNVVRLKTGKKPLVLVIEDYLDNQIAVQALLADSCNLLQAMDGQAGLDMAVKYHPDLLLVDISLPVKSGIEVLEAVRTEETLRHIPVVAMTARAMKGDREEFLAHGFDGYIAKPINGELLKKTIEELLDG